MKKHRIWMIVTLDFWLINTLTNSVLLHYVPSWVKRYPHLTTMSLCAFITLHEGNYELGLWWWSRKSVFFQLDQHWAKTGFGLGPVLHCVSQFARLLNLTQRLSSTSLLCLALFTCLLPKLSFLIEWDGFSESKRSEKQDESIRSLAKIKLHTLLFNVVLSCCSCCFWSALCFYLFHILWLMDH